MLREKKEKQIRMEIVILENLVPENHLLRKIENVIDFSFINEICKPYYCEDNGRPAIEPEILFRMLFIGYLYGIRSERRLVEEAPRFRRPASSPSPGQPARVRVPEPGADLDEDLAHGSGGHRIARAGHDAHGVHHPQSERVVL